MNTLFAFDSRIHHKLSRAEWTDRFVTRMSKLEHRADPWFIELIADDLWPVMHNMAPERAAEAEHAEWPQ